MKSQKIFIFTTASSAIHSFLVDLSKFSLPSDLFLPSCFPTKMSCSFVISTMSAICSLEDGVVSQEQVLSYISVPTDLNLVLEEYTQEGYRVLALAYKGLPRVNYVKVQRISREDAESNLIFLGLIVMENRLKPETTGIISMLHNASIRNIMVTGETSGHGSCNYNLINCHSGLVCVVWVLE